MVKNVHPTKKEIRDSLRKWMKENDYSVSMWENGFTEHDTESVLRDLQALVFGRAGLSGYLVMVWGVRDEYGYGGDADLYVIDSASPDTNPQATTISIPFLGQDTFNAFVDTVYTYAHNKDSLEWSKVEFYFGYADHNAAFEIKDDDDEDEDSPIMDAFDAEYQSDDEASHKKDARLRHAYETADEAGKKIIDDIFTTLCGYSLQTLMER